MLKAPDLSRIIGRFVHFPEWQKEESRNTRQRYNA